MHARSLPLHKTEVAVEKCGPPHHHPACPTLPPGQRGVGDSPPGDRHSPPAVARVATPLPQLTLLSQSWVCDPSFPAATAVPSQTLTRPKGACVQEDLLKDQKAQGHVCAHEGP